MASYKPPRCDPLGKSCNTEIPKISAHFPCRTQTFLGSQRLYVVLSRAPYKRTYGDGGAFWTPRSLGVFLPSALANYNHPRAKFAAAWLARSFLHVVIIRRKRASSVVTPHRELNRRKTTEQIPKGSAPRLFVDSGAKIISKSRLGAQKRQKKQKKTRPPAALGRWRWPRAYSSSLSAQQYTRCEAR